MAVIVTAGWRSALMVIAIRSNVGLIGFSCARGISLISLSSAECLSMNSSLPSKFVL